MNHDNVWEHSRESTLSHLVERACRHWDARRQAAEEAAEPAAPPEYTVALSREAGTQGTLVAHEVGRLLGWPVYDHELLERIAQDMGLRTSLLESVDERRQSLLLEAAEALLSAPRESDWGPLVSESAYVHHLVKVVLALGAHGECVIVGRGAAFILPATTTLRARLVGPVRERIAALSRQFGLHEREAARKARTLDRERNDFAQDHFLKDPTDPRNYDVVLNATRLTVPQCAELICGALHRLQVRGAERGR
jgi:cytidylate kinase